MHTDEHRLKADGPGFVLIRYDLCKLVCNKNIVSKRNSNFCHLLL